MAVPTSNSQVVAAADGDSKILGIELMRFISAVAVLVFHYQHFSRSGVRPIAFQVSAQPFFSYLSVLYTNGFYGVEVFWCISGFIFFWKYQRQLAEKRLGGYKFLVLRMSRLYPLHFVTLLFLAVMQYFYFSSSGAFFIYQANDLPHFVAQLFMASNWFTQVESFNGPIWSISIEILVYTCFFFSLRYISRAPALLLFVAVGAAAIQISKVSIHPFFVCLMFFYLGCLTASLYEWICARPSLKPVASVVALAVIAVSLVAAISFAIKPKYFLVIFTPALIYLCITYMPGGKFASRLLVPAGNMTYASYLLHIPIQISLVMLFDHFKTNIPFYSDAFFIGFIVLTLVLSYWTYEAFEMPAQKFLRRRLMRRPSMPISGPGVRAAES